MHICKYCNKEFETSLKLGGHVSKCKLNPNYENTILKIKLSITLLRLIYVCNCEVCKKEYNVTCTETDYIKSRYRKTCSDICAKQLTYIKTDKEEKNNKISKTVCKDDKKDIHTYRINKTRQSSKYKLYNFIVLTDGLCEYCGNYNCTSNICKLWTFLKVLTLIKKFGFDSTKLGTSMFKDEILRIKNDIELLYYNFGASAVCEKYNYNINHIGNILKMFNIQRLTRSEASHLNYKLGKIGNSTNNSQYKTEYHNTWDNKTVYLRSSYESDYAQELDSKKILYEVESLRIEYFDSLKNKKRIAVPDFYLPETNTIVEIKSTWTLNIQEMKDKFNEYNKQGYNTKLIYEHKETDINDI